MTIKFVSVMIKRSKLRGGNVFYTVLPTNVLREGVLRHV